MRFVLEVGIEPTLPKELDFESSASTNSATQGNLRLGCKSKKYFSSIVENSSISVTYLFK